MKEFLFIFRVSDNPDFKSSAAEIQEMMTGWQNWMGGIAARGLLVDKGNRLGVKEAKTVSGGGVVTDGPYTEVKEFINGYTLIKANTLEEAVDMAKGCPILFGGGKVEVRGVVTPDDFNG